MISELQGDKEDILEKGGLLEPSALDFMLSLRSSSFFCGSIHDKNACNLALGKIIKGGAVGGFNETVSYILGDVLNEVFTKKVSELKGQDREKMTMALSLPSENFIKYVDMTKIPPSLISYFEDPKLLDEVFGQLFFLRVPTIKNLVKDLPKSAVSFTGDGEPLIQNWIPTNALEYLCKTMTTGKMIPGITSLNRHGEGSIYDQSKAAELAKSYLDGFLFDERYPNSVSDESGSTKNKLPFGSYSIIAIGNFVGNEHGVSMIRHGPYDHRAIFSLFGNRISSTQQSTTDLEVILPNNIIDEIENSEDPKHIRAILLAYHNSLLIQYAS